MMALSLQLGYPLVPRSITNPNVSRINAIDVVDPMSYLTFIKLITVSFEPDSIQIYYNHYINSWNTTHNSINSVNANVITERYRDFLKEISISYTTLEEKEFLSKINFDDPYDLDVVMGFYGDKIKELISYYNSKRNDVKFNIVRNKLIGTNFGTEKTLTELTLSYLKSINDSRMLFDYDGITQNLDIKIGELYDTSPNYYDQFPNEKEYDNKDLDYGLDIFLKTNQELIDEIFPDISDKLKDIKEVDELFDTKRKLTQKYISTDFYYLSTGSNVTDNVSGKLFECDNTILNFLNKNYPTTASTLESKYLVDDSLQGFFKPSKNSILILDGINKSFSFNLKNTEPNSLYYFPDPSINSGGDDVVLFVADTLYLKNNFSTGIAVNQPISTPNDTKYYGYVSNIDPNKIKYFDSIFDSGFIQDSKYDIFGNQFGLFKNDSRFRKNIEIISPIDLTSMVMDGYYIYDDLYGEGYGFNYNTTNSEDSHPHRSGLYTKTAHLTSNEFDVLLSFGKLFQYAEPNYEKVFDWNPIVEIIDGGYIKNFDGTAYPDLSSSDLLEYAFDDGGYYYDDLIECGLHTASPLQRALVDPSYPSLTANSTQYLRGSALNVLDGGIFSDLSNNEYSAIGKHYAYDDTVFANTEYMPPLIMGDIISNTGTIFVKNTQTKQSLPLLLALPHLQYQYRDSIISQLSGGVVNFDMSNNSLIIETESYLIIDKLQYDGSFTESNTSPIYIEHNQSDFNKLSNRFKVNSFIYFCEMQSLSAEIPSNNFIIYPEIYRFDIINHILDKIYPQSYNEIVESSQFFNISGGDIRYTSLDAPVITHSIKNDMYNISFLMKDQNEMPTLHEYDFYLTPNVKFSDHNIIKFNSCQLSNIFHNLSTVSMYLSSSSYHPTIQEELIL
jgi:hypothetical protein